MELSLGLMIVNACEGGCLSARANDRHRVDGGDND